MVRGSLLTSAPLALAAGLFVTLSAQASPPPSLDLRGFRASTDPNAALYLEPAATPGHLQWNVGLWASYANRLLELQSADGHVVAIPVRHQLSLDYVASLGLGDRLALGVALPTVAYQSGDDTRDFLLDADSLPHTALGDLAFTAKATLIPSRQLGGFALAALARVSVPTGNTASYASEAASTGELRVLGELGLVALTVRATAGMRVRGAEQTYAGAEFGHELPWGAEITVLPQALGWDTEGRWRWNLEAHGAVALTPSFAARVQSPSVLGLSARYGVGDFGLTAGAELPLSDAIGAPRVRGVLSLTYAPRIIDTDKDGVADERDECPELAEDRDHFEDHDGCPDFDNDGDGVPDEQDKCPAAQEDSDGYQDEDGCPDPDNDHDGVPDQSDQCPNEPGAANGKVPGCPDKDRDLDGVPDPQDRCPAGPEDRDNYQDDDGCPDPDNDLDQVRDDEDTCPLKPGQERSDAKLNGCPSPDRDGDSFDDGEDKCPDQPEDFDGDDDLDGCPEPAGKNQSTARLEPFGVSQKLVLARPISLLADGSVDPKSQTTVRAVAALLNQKPTVVLMVGVRPDGQGAAAEQLALNKSFSIVEALRHYTHRDEVAETIDFSAVQRIPGAAQTGIGFLVLSAPSEPSPAATPPANPSAAPKTPAAKP
ncbi:MAG TPA: thrombospondin type 3 repeat-containing protein [Polyangiaceae bacterium]|nr:thrombospondin type 3 repeat-containing protein [Polyangiaceae bacterium]